MRPQSQQQHRLERWSICFARLLLLLTALAAAPCPISVVQLTQFLRKLCSCEACFARADSETSWRAAAKGGLLLPIARDARWAPLADSGGGNGLIWSVRSGAAMDYQAEQEMELEALEAILADDLTGGLCQGLLACNTVLGSCVAGCSHSSASNTLTHQACRVGRTNARRLAQRHALQAGGRAARER